MKKISYFGWERVAVSVLGKNDHSTVATGDYQRYQTDHIDPDSTINNKQHYITAGNQIQLISSKSGHEEISFWHLTRTQAQNREVLGLELSYFLACLMVATVR